MAKKTRTELSTLAINTNLPDNTTELITPTTERAQLTDERESVVNYKDDLGGVPNAGKFLTVAVDGESLTMVDAPTGDVTGTGAQYQLAVWDGTSALTGYAALTYISSILKAPQLRADSANGTVTINATDDAGGTAWLYFKNDDVLKAEISYFILDDFLTIRTYQKDIVFERATNTPTLTIDGTTGDATFVGSVTGNTGSKITSSSADTTFSIETTSGTTIFPILDFLSSHSTVGAKIRVDSSNVISISKGGDVGIGRTPSEKLHVQGNTRLQKTGVSGSVDLQFYQGNNASINNSVNYANIQSNVTSGNTGFESGKLVFQTRNSGTTATRLTITSGGLATFSNGIQFGTGATLDAYEEGTFTVSLISSGGGANLTPSNTTGYYTRVGNKVTIQYYSGSITVTNIGSGSGVVSGLPYASSSGVYHTLTLTHVNCYAALAQNGFVNPGTSQFLAIQSNTTATMAWKNSNGNYFMLGGTYLI